MVDSADSDGQLSSGPSETRRRVFSLLSSTFYKTKFCPQIQQKGLCSRGSGCVYAHSQDELRNAPNLTKTKMCPFQRMGERCLDVECNFAHEATELRHTTDVFKTKICHMWKKGKCVSGSLCRHAHGPSELLYHRQLARSTTTNVAKTVISFRDFSILGTPSSTPSSPFTAAETPPYNNNVSRLDRSVYSCFKDVTNELSNPASAVVMSNNELEDCCISSSPLSISMKEMSPAVPSISVTPTSFSENIKANFLSRNTHNGHTVEVNEEYRHHQCQSDEVNGVKILLLEHLQEKIEQLQQQIIVRDAIISVTAPGLDVEEVERLLSEAVVGDIGTQWKIRLNELTAKSNPSMNKSKDITDLLVTAASTKDRIHNDTYLSLSPVPLLGKKMPYTDIIALTKTISETSVHLSNKQFNAQDDIETNTNTCILSSPTVNHHPSNYGNNLISLSSIDTLDTPTSEIKKCLQFSKRLPIYEHLSSILHTDLLNWNTHIIQDPSVINSSEHNGKQHINGIQEHPLLSVASSVSTTPLGGSTSLPTSPIHFGFPNMDMCDKGFSSPSLGCFSSGLWGTFENGTMLPDADIIGLHDEVEEEEELPSSVYSRINWQGLNGTKKQNQASERNVHQSTRITQWDPRPL